MNSTYGFNPDPAKDDLFGEVFTAVRTIEKRNSEHWGQTWPDSGIVCRDVAKAFGWTGNQWFSKRFEGQVKRALKKLVADGELVEATGWYISPDGRRLSTGRSNRYATKKFSEQCNAARDKRAQREKEQAALFEQLEDRARKLGYPAFRIENTPNLWVSMKTFEKILDRLEESNR